MARRGKKKKKRTGLIITACIVLLLCGAITYQQRSLEKEKASYADRIAELEKEKTELNEEAADINEYSDYTQSKEYVEDTAREKLGLVYNNEIIFETTNSINSN